MSPTECVTIVGLIDARCPASKIADATADAWYLDLQHFDYEDAYEATLAISRRQAFVGLHDLLTETSTLQRQRLGRQRLAELAAVEEAENEVERLAIEASEPVDREAAKAQLAALAQRRAHAVPRVDPRPPSMIRTEARAELERKRVELAEACERFHPGVECKPGENHPAVSS